MLYGLGSTGSSMALPFSFPPFFLSLMPDAVPGIGHKEVNKARSSMLPGTQKALGKPFSDR